jgi:hypothetical protein
VSWGLEELGLDADADVRAVKRAYARLLRQTRPEDDPAAFQLLHEAYQNALEWVATPEPSAPARAPLGWQDAPASPAAPTPAAPVVPVAPAEPDAPTRDGVTPPVDIAAVAARIVTQAQAMDATSLHAWLLEQPELWSLSDAPFIGLEVLDALAAQTPPLPPQVIACLTGYFAWDDLQGEVDDEYLEHVARRCVQAWLLSPQGERTLGTRYMAQAESLLMPGSSVVRSLRTSRPHWRNLLTALAPGRGAEAVALLSALDFWSTREVPVGLDADQVRFWARFGNPADRIGLFFSATRVGLVGLFLGLICLWGVVSSWPLPPSGSLSGLQRATLIVAVGTLIVPTLWALGVGWVGLLRWQAAPERSDTALPALRILTVPLLVAAIAGGFWYALQVTHDMVWAAVIVTLFASGLTLHIAATRFRLRGVGLSPGKDDLVGLGMMLSVLLIVPAWVAALAFWAIDLHRHRHCLRW